MLQNVMPQSANKKLPPVGLGGWLTLFIISQLGVVVSIVSKLGELLFRLSSLNAFLLAYNFLLIFIEGIFPIVILVFLFKGKMLFRSLYLIQTIIFAFCLLALFALSIFDNTYSIIGSLLPLLIRILWTVYLYRSERVKNTFLPEHQQTKEEELQGSPS